MPFDHHLSTPSITCLSTAWSTLAIEVGLGAIMSSKKEQAALVAFFNSFNLSKRLTAFDQLGDGKVLLEVGRSSALELVLTK